VKKYEKPDGGFLELTEEEWEKQYPLVPNHFQPKEGNRFETYGEQAVSTRMTTERAPNL